MDQKLHRLVYYSRNRISGPREAVSDAIRQILESSQRNNEPVGVTGALMFNSGCFAQVLEGKREVIESTFERIQQDDRHGDVSLLAFEPIEERTFGNWSMSFVGRRAEDAAAFGDISAESGFDPSKANGDEVLSKLKALALEDEGAAI